MPYVNPGQLYQDYFQPTVKSVLPIVPSLLAAKRAAEERDLREGLAQFRWANEAGLRGAQANYYNSKAKEAEIANQAYSQLMGGSGATGPLGVKPEQAFAHKFFGVPYPTLKPIYQPATEPGQPGKYVFGYPEAGQETKPDVEQMSKLEYWLKGPEGWKQTSEMIPKETWNQRMKEIEAKGGQMNEPPEIAVQKAVDQYRALAPEKFAAFEASLKARGIDTTKWNQQQKFWYQVVKDKANREANIVAQTATSLKQAKIDLADIEKEVFEETQRIAQGIPPTYLTPPAGAQPAGPLPMAPQPGVTPQPQAAPQGGTGAPPADKLKQGVITTFKNGQAWTLENGQPKRVR